MPRTAPSVALLALCAFALSATAQPFGDDPFPKGKFDAPAPKLPTKFAKLADADVTVTPAKAKWGETVTIKITVAVKPGVKAWTYPFAPQDATQEAKNSLTLPAPGDLIFIGKLTDPPGAKTKPRALAKKGETDQYYDGPVSWELKAVVSPKATPGKKVIALDDIALQVCDDDNCHIAKSRHLPVLTLEVVEGLSEKANPADLTAAIGALKTSPDGTKTELEAVRTELEATKKALEELKAQKPVPPVPGLVTPAPGGPVEPAKIDPRKRAKDKDVYANELKELAARIPSVDKPPPPSLWGFVLTAAAWGLISLVTPCVFPMIPITVSIFLKQAHGSLRERLKLASVYCLTIISVLGVSAFALLKFMSWLSTHPVTNILLAVLFLVLALSLFGMYELTLPNSLQKRLQAKQSKGGTVGTIFGALAFTVISFTCVAPFLGGFAGISAGSDSSGGMVVVPTAREIAGGLAVATAFAAPFFILALVPGLMKALPKSGGWLDSVKVVMGFLELAAALKFLRTAELRLFPTPQYFTYDMVLGGWVAISGACGLYLLNVFRLPHDEEKPNIGVPRLLFALVFLGLALYLAPALIKGADGKPQRPAGTVYAWVEAFLLPEEVPAPAASKDDLWRTDLLAALEASEKSKRPVFLDFTGVTCTNCKINEQTVFPQAVVREELQKFEKVKFYTDEVPAALYLTDPGKTRRDAEADANAKFQVDVFKDAALPLYAVLMPQEGGQVKVIGVYPEGKINDPAKFVAFLKDAQEKAKPKK